MYCQVNKKRSFASEDLALEALIQHHISNFHPEGRGPCNVYQCDHCGSWHFTSRQPAHPILSSTDVIERIRNEQVGNYWERKLR